MHSCCFGGWGNSLLLTHQSEPLSPRTSEQVLALLISLINTCNSWSSKGWFWFFKFKDVQYLDSTHLSCLETVQVLYWKRTVKPEETCIIYLKDVPGYIFSLSHDGKEITKPGSKFYCFFTISNRILSQKQCARMCMPITSVILWFISDKDVAWTSGFPSPHAVSMLW